eukprot:jgi/Psemu1/33777/gm1.33777_g
MFHFHASQIYLPLSFLRLTVPSFPPGADPSGQLSLLGIVSYIPATTICSGSPLLVNQGVYVLCPKAYPYNPQPWDLIRMASTRPICAMLFLRPLQVDSLFSDLHLPLPV